ncbi:hypothetical protein DIS07_01535 [Polaribacter aquimarinus]|uniref:BioF2-like acetyltransferase domain-containing protein n=2 Tax=Polaribacter aquimarinus TaxID=2100726 RepID=A0A2U2JDV7_9FLAO|nr:hypothetical protein DIS07_01535 [Polaribacter aquimarinus]
MSWYLDIVAENWDVLVLNDYEAVMPLPWKKKYTIKYITQPYFCQQLGVFSQKKLSKCEEIDFVKKIPFYFFKTTLSFNAGNCILSNSVKLNYILDLSMDYTTLKKNFSKGRKHAIQKGAQNNLEIKTIEINEIIKLQKSNYLYFFPESKLEKLFECVRKKNIGEVLGVFKGNTFLGGGFFIRYKNRIIYLFSAFDDLGRKLQASSFLLSKIIEKESGQNLILDFEGGNMTNIGKFYRSFGAKVEKYPTINIYSIGLLFNKL